MTFYKGISHKTSLTLQESSNVLSSPGVASLSDVSESPEVENIKKLIADMSSELESVNKKLDNNNNNNNNNNKDLFRHVHILHGSSSLYN